MMAYSVAIWIELNASLLERNGASDESHVVVDGWLKSSASVSADASAWRVTTPTNWLAPSRPSVSPCAMLMAGAWIEAPRLS